MASLKERISARIRDVRQRRPMIDHAVRTQEHFSDVKAGQQAGAVTYFGFLSVFPVLCLAFFVIGYVSNVYSRAQDDLVEAIQSMMPGLIGDGDAQLSLADIQSAAGTVGLIGLVGVLYSGLGWLSALRDALITVFVLPEREQPNFIMGKVRDLITLAIIGVFLLIAVAVTGVVAGFSKDILAALELDSTLTWVVKLITIAFGLLANAVLFLVIFRLLAAPGLPWRALLAGALLGGIAFEILKQASTLLISLTEGQPAFQVFGLALILVVWINYSSRVILYAAAWAWTDPRAVADRIAEPAEPVQGPPLPSLDDLPTEEKSRKGVFAAGAAAGAAATAAAIKRRSDDR